MHHKGECVLDKIDCINDSFIKPCFQGPSEIFSPLFGCHQEFLLCNLGWGRAFGLEGEFEVADDSIHHRIISDKGLFSLDDAGDRFLPWQEKCLKKQAKFSREHEHIVIL